MAEYIKREEAIHIAFKSPFFSDSLMEEIKAIPAADVAPVRHGKWEIVVGSNGKEYMVCTFCRVSQDLIGVFTYCPNCGAKMDLEG